jgi:hypothetical protein
VVCIQWGDTALMKAVEQGHAATVQALIGAGANPNLQNKVSDCACSYKCFVLSAGNNGVTACVGISCVDFLLYLFGRTCCCVSDVIGLVFGY